MTRSRKLRAVAVLALCSAYVALYVIQQIDLPPMHWAGE